MNGFPLKVTSYYDKMRGILRINEFIERYTVRRGADNSCCVTNGQLLKGMFIIPLLHFLAFTYLACICCHICI